MRTSRVLTFTAPLVLSGATAAFAATSGTPLDTVTTQVMQIVSGPIALLLIIAGFAGAGIIYFLGRNFEVAFVPLAALAIGAGCFARRSRRWLRSSSPSPARSSGRRRRRPFRG